MRIAPLGQTFLYHIDELLRAPLRQSVKPGGLLRSNSGSGDDDRFPHVPSPPCYAGGRASSRGGDLEAAGLANGERGKSRSLAALGMTRLAALWLERSGEVNSPLQEKSRQDALHGSGQTGGTKIILVAVRRGRGLRGTGRGHRRCGRASARRRVRRGRELRSRSQ